MIRVVVAGAFGRMGATLSQMVTESDVLDSSEASISGPGPSSVSGSSRPADRRVPRRDAPGCLIDFTVAAAAVGNIRAAADHGVALVVGTTGFSDVQVAANRVAIDGRIPAVISLELRDRGKRLLATDRQAAPLLAGYDIEVTEAHHRYKKDAPSGTAKTMLAILEDAIGEREKTYGREGMTERGDEIGVHVIRGGDIIGDHAVLFAGNYETVTLSHRAYDRAVFAKGALRAAEWVVGRPAGIHTFAEVLGLEP